MMIRKFVRSLIVLIFVFTFVAGPLGLGTALAEDVPFQTPGEVEGVGLTFQVTGSDYLDVSLVSTELVYAYISSVPSVIELRVEAADGAAATQLSLNGLAPGVEYHLYTDDLHNHAVMTTDEAGSISWSQDLVEPHLIFIQTVPSTIFIGADGSGCGSDVGDWDPDSLTCTLTTNLSDTIQIDGSGVTLNGAGHTLSGPSTLGHGVFIGAGKNAVTSGVTVVDLNIEGFVNGIYLYNAQNCEVRGNTIGNSENKVTNGLKIWPRNPNYGGGNEFTGNQIQAETLGIHNKHNANAFQRNTIRSAGAALRGTDLGDFYNNNLLDYQVPFFSTNSSQLLSADLPFGGNNWFSYDAPIEGCDDLNVDGFCDAAYLAKDQTYDQTGHTGGQDLYPWTKPDGWLDIEINADPNVPIMYDPDGVTIQVSAHFKDVDVDATHTAVEWDWGDGTTSDAVVSSEADGEGDVALTYHTYEETGVYEIKLTMQDKPYLSTVVESYKYVVVYDPSAGFVTGGGYIESPAGAYVPDPTLSGQATFGFIAKFYRTRTGENELEGNTVFEFHTAGLRFTSTSYVENYLVVKNAKAIYRGTGTCEDSQGTKGCDFMLTAQDFGDEGDMFRIQIWDGDQAASLIYDNKLGAAPNDMDAGTMITEGSIIIQTSSTKSK